MARLLYSVLIISVLCSAQQAPPSPGFEISGTVVDAAGGQPLSRVRLRVAPVTQRNAYQLVTTREDGRFLFSGLARGKYALTAQRRGYLFQSFDQHGPYATSIAVGPDQDAHNLVFRLRAEASISGKIVDEHNDPVANAQLILFEAAAAGEATVRNSRAQATSNDEGYYRFNHLAPGKYWLAITAQPWYAQHEVVRNIGGRRTLRRISGASSTETTAPETTGSEESNNELPRSALDVAFPVTYYPGVTDSASAGTITLTAGEKFTADVMLQAVPAIHFRLPMEAPPGVHYYANLRQQIMGGQWGGSGMSSTEISPGVIEFSGVTPGHYEMDISAWDEKNSSSAKVPTPPPKQVDVGPNGEITAREVPANVGVSGLVKFDNDDVPGSANVYLRNHNTGQYLSSQVSPKGDFEFKDGAAAGTYEIGVNAQGALIRGITATGAKVIGQSVQIGGASPVRLNLLVTRGLGHIDGTALRDDKPLGGVTIVLAPEDPAHNAALFRGDQSDSDGTFTLNSIIPGKYTVVAIQNGWEMNYRDPALLKPYLAQGTPIQVESKGKYKIKVKAQPGRLTQ